MQPQLPVINEAMLRWFRRFVRYYLRKHFHALAVQRQTLPAISLSANDSLVVYANHASWWDPLTAIHLSSELFSDFRMYAPIDAEALAKYPMFAKMGFFGIQANTREGVLTFLQFSQAILQRPGSSLWLTPEGRFADVRDNSADLMPGLGHLAWKLSLQSAQQVTTKQVSPTGPERVWFLPVAVEYPFWEERQPELLVWFGQPIDVSTLVGCSKQQCLQQLTAALRKAQQALARASVARDSSQFEVLAAGHTGSFWLYDWWRARRGVIGKEKSQRGHSGKLTS